MGVWGGKMAIGKKKKGGGEAWSKVVIDGEVEQGRKEGKRRKKKGQRREWWLLPGKGSGDEKIEVGTINKNNKKGKKKGKEEIEPIEEVWRWFFYMDGSWFEQKWRGKWSINSQLIGD